MLLWNRTMLKRVKWKQEVPSKRSRMPLFDPCASRYYPELQGRVCGIRRMQQGLHGKICRMTGKKRAAAGYGGHIGIASPSHTSYMTTSRAKEEELPYVTYCVNCRESFAGQGKEAVHILDLLFGLNGAGRPAATVTERCLKTRPGGETGTA